ncbi:septum formation protein Maf [Candidatus Bathyarchaeota archaeon]|nr:septum formation protein Maf [Candidatus Bathyarchaeota archaeon]
MVRTAKLPKIVLASSSPRRVKLLKQLGVPFEVVEPDGVHEEDDGVPEEVVLRNAQAKADHVASKLDEGIVIGADTIVVLGDTIIGKAMTDQEATEMLTALQGRTHRVLTGLAVVDASSKRTETDVVETVVTFQPLTEDEVARYVASGEPLGKAGGYAVQGLGAVIVEEVHGCFYNVVGLPLYRLNVLLEKFGIILL